MPTRAEKARAISELHRQWVRTAQYQSIPVVGDSQYPETEEDVHTMPESDDAFMRAMRAILDEPTTPDLPVLVASVEVFGSPNQARILKGNGRLSGRWTDTAKAILGKITGMDTGGGESLPGLVESNDAMWRPTLNEDEIKNMRGSYVSGSHIDENGEWTPERKAEQERIVNEFLDGVAPAPDGEAVAYFNGGGPGSGKGGFTSGKINTGYPPTRSVNDLTGEMDFAGMPNPGAVLVDPESIKMQLPEVKSMRDTLSGSGVMTSGPGSNWAGQSHEESSYIAKMVYAEALRRNLPVVYDGTGMKITGKAQEALDAGYKEVHANYMYVEPKAALGSAIERAGRIGRNVPADMQAGQYAGMPDAFEKTAGSGLFKTVSLYDRNGLKQGEEVPKIFEILPSGERKILDPVAYKRFLSSGTRLPDLSGT